MLSPPIQLLYHAVILLCSGQTTLAPSKIPNYYNTPNFQLLPKPIGITKNNETTLYEQDLRKKVITVTSDNTLTCLISKREIVSRNNKKMDNKI